MVGTCARASRVREASGPGAVRAPGWPGDSGSRLPSSGTRGPARKACGWDKEVLWGPRPWGAQRDRAGFLLGGPFPGRPPSEGGWGGGVGAGAPGSPLWGAGRLEQMPSFCPWPGGGAVSTARLSEQALCAQWCPSPSPGCCHAGTCPCHPLLLLRTPHAGRPSEGSLPLFPSACRKVPEEPVAVPRGGGVHGQQ